MVTRPAFTVDRAPPRLSSGVAVPGYLLIFNTTELDYTPRSNLRGATPQISLLHSCTASAHRGLWVGFSRGGERHCHR